MRKEKGEREGEKTWVFHPRIIMAEAWSRMRGRFALSGQQDELSANSFNKPALSERRVGMIVFKI